MNCTIKGATKICVILFIALVVAMPKLHAQNARNAQNTQREYVDLKDKDGKIQTYVMKHPNSGAGNIDTLDIENPDGSVYRYYKSNGVKRDIIRQNLSEPKKVKRCDGSYTAAAEIPSTMRIRTDTLEVELPDGSIETRYYYSEAECDEFIYNGVGRMPSFPGGDVALNQYVSAHIRYPEYEMKNKIEGMVSLKFIITKAGKIKNIQVLQMPENGQNLAAEAIRVVQGMPDWQAGLHNGKPVNVSIIQSVNFKLE